MLVGEAPRDGHLSERGGGDAEGERKACHRAEQEPRRAREDHPGDDEVDDDEERDEQDGSERAELVGEVARLARARDVAGEGERRRGPPRRRRREPCAGGPGGANPWSESSSTRRAAPVGRLVLPLLGSLLSATGDRWACRPAGRSACRRGSAPCRGQASPRADRWACPRARRSCRRCPGPHHAAPRCRARRRAPSLGRRCPGRSSCAPRPWRPSGPSRARRWRGQSRCGSSSRSWPPCEPRRPDHRRARMASSARCCGHGLAELAAAIRWFGALYDGVHLVRPGVVAALAAAGLVGQRDAGLLEGIRRGIRQIDSNC